MARIYLVEPGTSSGPGAMGVRVLRESLREAGHAATLVQPAMRGATTGAALRTEWTGGEELEADESVARASDLPTPDAWFISCVSVRQWVLLPRLFRWLGLAPLARDRPATAPLVAFGGYAAQTPEPFADFADVVASGDGEETGVVIADLVGVADKATVLRLLDQRSAGFYVPGRYPGHDRPRFSRLESPSLRPIVTMTNARNHTAIVEVARGCRSRCSFCSIGWGGGTYREAPEEEIGEVVRSLAGRKLNLFAADYSSVSYASEADALLARYGCTPLSRDARMDATLSMLKGDGVAKSFSFGVEGLSERLRRAVGKALPEAKILETMRRLRNAGVPEVKWYVILGLPGEEDSDLAEMIALLSRVRAVYPGKLEVTITFLHALPHTPLQWADSHYSEEALLRAQTLRHEVRRLHPQWVASVPLSRELQEHEAMLPRLGREGARYLLSLDSNQAKIKDGRWRAVAQESGIDVARMLGPWEVGAPTPWDFVDVGISREKVVAGWSSYWKRLENAEPEREFAA